MSDYLENIFSLKNKTALITGGSKGIGAGIVSAFINAGANVVSLSRSKPILEEQDSLSYYQCDISDLVEFERICKLVDCQYGGIDILVNAAGISLSSESFDNKFERFNKTLLINLVATYQCCEVASKFMHHNSSIINITSIGSKLGFPENPGYVANKGGVMALTKSLAMDLSLKNIRVNNIVPGYIKTDMTRKSFKDEVLHKERLDRMIIKRWGEVDDITGAAIFLASNASSYMTGSDVVVDGGWVAKGI